MSATFFRYVQKPFGIALLFLLTLAQSVLGQTPDPDELISVSLFSDASTIKRGDSVWLGVEIEIEKDWHIYWKTSGETGLPTEIEWTISLDAKIEPTLYPTPYFYEYQGSASYAYKEKILLLTKLNLPVEGEIPGGVISVKCDLSALVCNEFNCLPYGKELSLELPIGVKTVLDSKFVEKISAAEKKHPVAMPSGSNVSALAKGESVGIEWQDQDLGKLKIEQFDFFAQGDFFDHSFRPKFEKTEDGYLIASLKKSDDVEGVPESVRGVLSHPALERAWLVNLQVDQAVYGKVSETLRVLPLTPWKKPVPRRVDCLFFGRSWVWYWLPLPFGHMGRTNQPVNSAVQRTRGKVLTLAFLGAGVWLGYPEEEDDRGLNWQDWSPEMQESLLAEGRAVYVDYTAKWCQSCQFNKRIYESEEVIAQFEDLGIVPLKADWTKRGTHHSPITRVLQAQGCPSECLLSAVFGAGEQIGTHSLQRSFD
jgi:DsbC/DsbD-like thiol-disulfide interchange protein